MYRACRRSVNTKMDELPRAMITAITPYFLEKGVSWFEKNYQKIAAAGKTQSFFADNVVLLEKNKYLKISEFLRKLDELGYEKMEIVHDLGDFACRGGIVDVFPVNSRFPLRIEFSGNYIERILRAGDEIRDEKTAREILKKKLKNQRIYGKLGRLKDGDPLVHLDHGIGIYRQELKINGEDYFFLEYAGGDKLYVPKALERKLSRYLGFSIPKISRLGSPLWQKLKQRIKENAEKFAKELLAVYAKREISTRPAWLPESEIDAEIKSSFPFEETPDQIQTMEEISKDLSREKPMDRIICGDSGFGKTEIALRTMARAVNSGYQTAMICPTTILASQHFNNFNHRLKKLPIKTAMLSRLQLKKEQKKIIEDLKKGSIDIVIGTHRLLSADVCFRKLGLLVIDEEQRFGVRQKEKFKKIRAQLDILSLSATPIPRTLYLALSNLRDISFVQTPPVGRKPVKTFISPWSKNTVKEAINFELTRDGQVYYLHNRVETIGTAKKMLEKLSDKNPGWKIGIIHGRMNEKDLVLIMNDFQEKKINILVATTIIETGLDLPNVNTLIVVNSAKLGLSQAYQIRGRVGRSAQQGFAYFLFGRYLTEKAEMRLTALKEAEALGSGYLIAQRDLEIRGAGNILGKEQSGNINAVGLNLYCQMIAEAIEKLKV